MRGFEIIEHTADVGVRAFGSSLAELFENCALGMMAIVLDPEKVRRDRRLRLDARGSDRESLLVSWLAEILYRVDAEGWAFGGFEVSEMCEESASGWGSGEPLDPGRHDLGVEIKAPTYHMLELEEKGGLWTAQVIFDV